MATEKLNLSQVERSAEGNTTFQSWTRYINGELDGGAQNDFQKIDEFASQISTQVDEIPIVSAAEPEEQSPQLSGLKIDGTTYKLAGGTTDYEELNNQPQINGTTLIGNKTIHELGIQPFKRIIKEDSIDCYNEISLLVSNGYIPYFLVNDDERLYDGKIIYIYCFNSTYEEQLYYDFTPLIGGSSVTSFSYSTQEETNEFKVVQEFLEIGPDGIWVDTQKLDQSADSFIPKITVSNTGTSTEIVNYIQVGNSEYKIGGSGSEYELPIATSSSLGGIKVGTGLAINSDTGMLSLDTTDLLTTSKTIVGAINELQQAINGIAARMEAL